MRLIIILSPTNKYDTKTEYSKLRKFLLSDGYTRIAEEVFQRTVINRKDANKHYSRFLKYLPSTGCVRYIQLTEKQYKNIKVFNHEEDIQEEIVGNKMHVML